MRGKPPSPTELLRAHRTLEKLSRSIPYDEVVDMDGSRAWDGLVEGRRMLAVTTAWLGSQDKAYRDIWNKMLRLDEET